MRVTNSVPESIAADLVCPQSLQNGEYSTCRGVACMAWRFVDLAQPRSRVCDNPTATVEPTRPLGVPAVWEWFPYSDEDGEPAAWLESLADAHARRSGYCGIAGRPEAPTDELLSRVPELVELFRAVMK